MVIKENNADDIINSTDEDIIEEEQELDPELELQKQVLMNEEQQDEEQQQQQQQLDKSKKNIKKEKVSTDPNLPPSLELEKLEGIGKERADKLRSFGVYDIPGLALCNANELLDTLSNGGATKNVSLDYCSKLVVLANRYLEDKGILSKPLSSSKVLLDEETVRERFSSGDKNLDGFLGGGGFESKSLTEIYGAFGCGKTQICYSTIALAASQDKKVLFIDTENTYSPERVNEISLLNNYDANKVQNNILVLKPSSVALLINYMRKLEHFVHNNEINVIIVDSIIALHKAEYIGRGLLAPKQQSLTQVMSKLVKVAQFYHCAVIATNHVIANPDPMKSGGDELAAGGNSIAHYSTHRIYLKKRGIKTQYTVARMVDSPRYAQNEISFFLKPEGVVWMDPAKPRKSE